MYNVSYLMHHKFITHRSCVSDFFSTEPVSKKHATRVSNTWGKKENALRFQEASEVTRCSLRVLNLSDNWPRLLWSGVSGSTSLFLQITFLSSGNTGWLTTSSNTCIPSSPCAKFNITGPGEVSLTHIHTHARTLYCTC